jgi:hypothetical protein
MALPNCFTQQSLPQHFLQHTSCDIISALTETRVGIPSWASAGVVYGVDTIIGGFCSFFFWECQRNFTHNTRSRQPILWAWLLQEALRFSAWSWLSLDFTPWLSILDFTRCSPSCSSYLRRTFVRLSCTYNQLTHSHQQWSPWFWVLRYVAFDTPSRYRDIVSLNSRITED